MKSEEEIITEYNILQDEIKTNSQIIAQIFTVTITATGLLIGYAFQSKNWIVFFSPFAILLPSLWFISSQLESTIRIASYIKIFIEPKIEGLKWESRLFKLRNNSMITEHKYTMSITGIYGTIGFACLLLSWIFLDDFSQIKIILNIIESTIIGSILLIVILNVRNCFGLKCYTNYCNAWEESNKKE